MAERYAKFILKWRWLVVIATTVLVLFAASGGRWIEFTTDYRVFFSEENPQLNAFEALQDTYTKNDNVLFVVAPKSGKVFTRESLAGIEWLTNESWQIPYSLRVDSLTNFQHTYATEDDLVVEDLVVDAQALDDAALQKIRKIALQEPQLVNRLVSPSGHVSGVNVTIQLPGVDEGREVPEVAAFVRDLAQQVRDNYPDIEVYLTGISMLNNAFPEASKTDMQTLVPLMFLIVILLLALLLRVISGTIVTVLVILFSIVAAMGMTGWLGIRLTPPSSAAPTIILTIAIADCVHILVGFIGAMRAGADKYAAMTESLRINLQPVFLTSITTIIGFMSMNFSDAPPFRDLGNIVAMGVAAAFILSVSFLPAMMMLLPVRISAGQSTGSQVMARFGDFVVRRRAGLFWGMATVIVFLLAFIPKNELNDVFVEYFDETVDFRRATDFATANLTGIYQIEYSLPAGEAGGINEPAYLNSVERFASWYQEQPETLHVNTISDVMKRLNKNLHGDDPAYYRMPEQRDLAAQYLFLYEMSLPYGLDLNNQINLDKSATRFTVTLKSISSNEILALDQRAQQWLKANAPALQTPAASTSIMFAYIGARNITSMLTGTVLALILISLILVFALRSVKVGLASMIPNLVPAGMAFGLWGIFVGQVGLALSVVIGMTLGIVVDDTVHFLSKYQRARREQGMDAPDAIRYAFTTVGMALWITSLVLIVGFLVLSLSAFELNSSMGLMTALTLALALAADFLFLPPLLMKIEEKRNETDSTRTTADSASA